MNDLIIKKGKELLNYINENAPTLLAWGAGILGGAALVTSNVATAKVTREIVEEEHARGEEMSIKEKIKLAAPNYIMPVAFTAASGLSLIKSNGMHLERLAAATGELAFYKKRAELLDKNAKEQLSKKEYEKLKDNVAKDEVRSSGPVGFGAVYLDPPGTPGLFLVHDPWSGRQFYATANRLDKACIMLNNEMSKELSASLNDFYDFIELGETIPGRGLIFEMERVNDAVEIDYRHIRFDDDPAGFSVPVLTLDFVGQQPHTRYGSRKDREDFE